MYVAIALHPMLSLFFPLRSDLQRCKCNCSECCRLASVGLSVGSPKIYGEDSIHVGTRVEKDIALLECTAARQRVLECRYSAIGWKRLGCECTTSLCKPFSHLP